jgi:hypothetical protein
MEAKVCSICKEEKGILEFHKLKSGKYGRESRCKECSKADKKAYYQKNKEVIIKKNLEYQKTNPDIVNRSSKKWRDNNKEKQAYLTKEWSKQNRGSINNNCAKRRSLKLKATPDWSECEKIKKVYIGARKLEELTGLKYHVDHIVPLQGKDVCGLHVWENLQVLEASLNIKKGNRHE